MTDDIVARLRDLKNAMNECGFTGISAVTNAAADEIERLRAGGCARDQTTTQFCAEAAYLQIELTNSRTRNCDLIVKQGEMRSEIIRLQTALQEIADNINNEPYAADHARDALKGSGS